MIWFSSLIHGGNWAGGVEQSPTRIRPRRSINAWAHYVALGFIVIKKRLWRESLYDPGAGTGAGIAWLCE